MTPESKLAALGITLPQPAAPLANYVPVKRSGTIIYVSGQLPLADGNLLAEGKTGSEVSPERAAVCARQCIINALAAIRGEVGTLDRIFQIVKLTGFVASAPGFTGQPAVINGASDFLVEVFGDAGRHARSAVGVSELPRNAPVEIELIAELK